MPTILREKNVMVPPARRRAAGDRQLGGTLAVAVFGTLVANREAFVQGMQASVAIAALLLLVSAGISLQLAASGAYD